MMIQAGRCNVEKAKTGPNISIDLHISTQGTKARCVNPKTQRQWYEVFFVLDNVRRNPNFTRTA